MARTGASRRAGASTSARPGAAGSTGHEGQGGRQPPGGSPWGGHLPADDRAQAVLLLSFAMTTCERAARQCHNER